MGRKLIDPRKTDLLHLKVLLYGAPGAGKTSVGCTAPNPLFILSEVQGIATIRERGPDSKVILVDSASDAEAVLEEVRKGVHDCDTVVLDSLTDLNEALQETNYDERTDKVNWMKVQPATKRLAASLRNLRKHVLCICLQKEKFLEADDVVVRQPALPGALGASIPQYFSAVGCVTKVRRKDGDGVEHKVFFREDHRLVTKPLSCLDPIETPDFSAWAKKYRGTGK